MTKLRKAGQDVIVLLRTAYCMMKYVFEDSILR